ncbi:MAG: hypothetical protein WCP21_12760 [Armatimonadota bacterium]
MAGNGHMIPGFEVLEKLSGDGVRLLDEAIHLLLLTHVAALGGPAQLGEALVKLRQLLFKFGLIVHDLPMVARSEKLTNVAISG